MTVKKNHQPLTECQVLLACIKYYLTDIGYLKKVLFVWFISTVCRHMLKYQIRRIKMGLDKSSNIDGDTWGIFVFLMASSVLATIGDYIIFYCTSIFQTDISVKALQHILKSESAGNIDLTSGKTQYAISEGSFAMAKLLDHCFVEIFVKIAYMSNDLVTIYTQLTFTHVILALFIILVAGFMHVQTAIISMNNKRRINTARGMCDKHIYEDIISYEIIKSYQTEDMRVKSYEEKITPWRDASIHQAKTTVFMAFLHDLVFTIAAYFSIKLLKYQGNSESRIYKNSYDCFYNLELSIENISTIYRKYKESIVTSRMLLYYLNEIEGFNPGTMTKKSFDKDIRFENVSYSIKDVNIFSDINFTISKNDKVCIFGRNGSGKSTISRLIMRLCNIKSGRILMDDTDIYQILMEDYRSLITYVPQDTNLCDDTVFNNLVYGNNQPFNIVVEECKKMNIHDDIMKLQCGYNTSVGERGCHINGGLRQKIFYVRAILKSSPIYIFDEPTNNLDEASALNVINLILGERFSDRTVIVICHDHELVLKFPKVFKFANGEIKETRNLID